MQNYSKTIGKMSASIEFLILLQTVPLINFSLSMRVFDDSFSADPVRIKD